MKKFLKLFIVLVFVSSISHSQVPFKKREYYNITNYKIPLLVINGKSFIGMSLNNFYFDTSVILRLELIKPENIAVNQYGPEAENGVILLETSRTIEWISTKDIFKSLATDSSMKYEEVLFSLNHSHFIPNPCLYFDKNTIKESKSEKDAVFFADKWFSTHISITLQK